MVTRPSPALFTTQRGDAEVGVVTRPSPALFTTQRDWQLLFIECWARAVRDPERGAEWARQRRTARAVIASFFERHLAAASDPHLQVQTIDHILTHAAAHPTTYLPTHDPNATTRLAAGSAL